MRTYQRRSLRIKELHSLPRLLRRLHRFWELLSIAQRQNDREVEAYPCLLEDEPKHGMWGISPTMA